jgi:hypothetical protein
MGMVFGESVGLCDNLCLLLDNNLCLVLDNTLCGHILLNIGILGS